MASSSSALIHLKAVIEAIPDAGTASGELRQVLENATGGLIFSQGTGSGQVDRVYYRDRTATGDGTLGSGATDSYDLLAAGSLTDILGQAIDADELKALFVLPTSGSIRIDAPASAFLTIFGDATDLINVPSDGLLMSWGAAGLDVTTNSKFDITETTSAATASYKLIFICAQ